MKNYYDELEVNKNASKEVIEKVYRVLAKKYHPDTTTEDNKAEAEEKFKAISVAYETLSDDEKRKNYDLELENSNPSISYEDYMSIVKERDELNYALNNLKASIYNRNYSNSNSSNYSNVNAGNYSNLNYNSNTNYNNQNSNRTYNPNYNSQTYSTNTYNTKRKKYYYTSTGKPASVLDYIKYKIKEFFRNAFILILSVILAILIVGTFTNFNILGLFL